MRKAYTYNIQLQRTQQTAHSACSVYHVVNISGTAESGYNCIETNTLERFCIPNFGMIFDCAFPKKARSEKRNFQCFAFRKSDSTSFPRVAMQNKMESVEGVEQDQRVVKYL